MRIFRRNSVNHGSSSSIVKRIVQFISSSSITTFYATLQRAQTNKHIRPLTQYSISLTSSIARPRSAKCIKIRSWVTKSQSCLSTHRNRCQPIDATLRGTGCRFTPIGSATSASAAHGIAINRLKAKCANSQPSNKASALQETKKEKKRKMKNAAIEDHVYMRKTTAKARFRNQTPQFHIGIFYVAMGYRPPKSSTQTAHRRKILHPVLPERQRG